MPTKEERDWAMFCHLSSLLDYVLPPAGIVTPIILWSMKRHESEFIDDQGREAINFTLSCLLYFLISIVLCFVLIGFVMLIALGIFELVACVMAAVQASRGERYRYPLTIRFI